jgi:hypothetical protein
MGDTAKVIVVSHGRTLYPPEARGRRLWDIIVFVSIAYASFSVPMRMSFVRTFVSDSELLLWMVCDAVFDAVLVTDMFLKLRHFSYSVSGQLLTEPALAMRHYVKTDFALDLCSLLPLNWVGLAVLGANPAQMLVLSYLRLPRVVRAIRFPVYFNSMENALEEANLRPVSGLWRMTKMIFYLLLVTQVLAAVFWAVTVSERDDCNSKQWPAFKESMHVRIWTASWAEQFLVSWYWATYTVTTVGYGDVTPASIAGMLICCFSMLMGSVLCDAGITAILSSLIDGIDMRAGDNRRRIDSVKPYMKYRQFAKSLQDRILNYYRYLSLDQKDVSEPEVLADLSSSQRTELLLHFCYEPLRAMPLFASYSPGFIRSLVRYLVHTIALPGEKMLIKDLILPDIFVLKRGRATIQFDDTIAEQLLTGGAGGDAEVDSDALAMFAGLGVQMSPRKSSRKTLTRGSVARAHCMTIDVGSVIGDFSEAKATVKALSFCELYKLEDSVFYQLQVRGSTRYLHGGSAVSR